MITGQTQIVGVMGCPVSHTASPRMHMAAYSELNLPFIYVPFLVEPEYLAHAVAGIRALTIRGVNVTIPHKETVMPFLDRIDSHAMRIGAVNTIVNESGSLVGYNTDGDGFLLAIYSELEFDIRGKHMVILGAGGAARAIAWATMEAGAASLVFINRRLEKVISLVKSLHLGGHSQVSCLTFEDDIYPRLNRADIVVQTTPVGMFPDSQHSPLDDFSWVSAQQVCCDIVYKPAETVFMHRAKAAGAIVLGGAGMLAGQGCLAFQYFTDHDIAYEVMRKALG